MGRKGSNCLQALLDSQSIRRAGRGAYWERLMVCTCGAASRIVHQRENAGKGRRNGKQESEVSKGEQLF